MHRRTIMGAAPDMPAAAAMPGERMPELARARRAAEPRHTPVPRISAAAAKGPQKGERTGPAPLDFAAINAAALSHLETLCARWLRGGRRIGPEWRCGSLGGEAGGSLGVRLRGARAGAWQDFATGDKGGDPISLAAAIFRITQTEAARRLAAMLGIGSEDRRHG